MKVLLLSESIGYPFDEGLKVILWNLMQNLSKHVELLAVTDEHNNTQGLNLIKVRMGKSFCNKAIKDTISHFSPDTILYVPSASHTFNSFLRARILKWLNPSAQIALFGVQHRDFSKLQGFLLKFLKPDILFLLSKHQIAFFETKGIFVRVLSPSIDIDRFSPIGIEQKIALRKKYNIPCEKKIALHIGHIKESRNLLCLVPIQKLLNFQVVVVGSTTTKQEKSLKDILRKEEIIVIDSYQSNIEEIYQLADIYVFPVINKNAAIDMPLSVLEAMACNLPVATTCFGGLVDYFKEDSDFKYFDSCDELVKIIEKINYVDVKNNVKVRDFTWSRFTRGVMESFEKL